MRHHKWVVALTIAAVTMAATHATRQQTATISLAPVIAMGCRHAGARTANAHRASAVTTTVDDVEMGAMERLAAMKMCHSLRVRSTQAQGLNVATFIVVRL